MSLVSVVERVTTIQEGILAENSRWPLRLLRKAKTTTTTFVCRVKTLRSPLLSIYLFILFFIYYLYLHFLSIYQYII